MKIVKLHDDPSIDRIKNYNDDQRKIFRTIVGEPVADGVTMKQMKEYRKNQQNQNAQEEPAGERAFKIWRTIDIENNLKEADGTLSDLRKAMFESYIAGWVDYHDSVVQLKEDKEKKAKESALKKLEGSGQTDVEVEVEEDVKVFDHYLYFQWSVENGSHKLRIFMSDMIGDGEV